MFTSLSRSPLFQNHHGGRCNSHFRYYLEHVTSTYMTWHTAGDALTNHLYSLWSNDHHMPIICHVKRELCWRLGSPWHFANCQNGELSCGQHVINKSPTVQLLLHSSEAIGASSAGSYMWTWVYCAWKTWRNFQLEFSNCRMHEVFIQYHSHSLHLSSDHYTKR